MKALSYISCAALVVLLLAAPFSFALADDSHPSMTLRDSVWHLSEILVEESPVIPLFWYTPLNPCTARLRNFKPNPTQSADTWNAALWYLSP